MLSSMKITAFYSFKALTEDECARLRDALHTFGEEHDMRGLVLIATEGINGTVCATNDVMTLWKKKIEEHFGDMRWNDSEAETHVFPRWFVKIRPEIVAIKKEEIVPQESHYLSPTEWNAMMHDDVAIIDARNTYETAIGMFEKAIDPKTQCFQEFADFASSCDLPKDKKILMYCTGGIRCEKAAVAMEKAGYTNVYQLKGGILNYLKESPNTHFKGECFVFDHRVSVDQDLKPSKRYSLCPHCGDPGDLSITCVQCGKSGIICKECSQKDYQLTCSKLCKHQFMGLQKRVVV